MDDSQAVLARTLPSSLEAEQAVIGAMLGDRNVVAVAAEELTADDFYYKQYGQIFETLIEMDNEGLPSNDPAVVINRLRERGVPPEYAEPKFLAGLSEMVFSANIRNYCKIVKDKSMLRKIIKTNQEIENACYEGQDSAEEIMDMTEQDFLKLLQKRGVSDFEPIDQVVVKAIDKIEDAYKHQGDVTGISTGFIDLNYQTAGLQPSDLILIAARPSMGKTAFALNIANFVALHEKLTVAIFSLEMSKEQLVNRLLAMVGNIDAQHLRTGNLSDSEWTQLFRSGGEIAQSNLIIDDTAGISISELRSKCRKYKQEKDLKLIIIDYLQLMTSGGREESRQQEISNISRSLKELARELNVPVIALSQLNRGVEQREDKRPMLSDLRDSGAIEQDADVVMFIYRDDYYNKDSKMKGVAEIIVAKQRNGPVGTVNLLWVPELTLFRNLEHRQKDGI